MQDVEYLHHWKFKVHSSYDDTITPEIFQCWDPDLDSAIELTYEFMHLEFMSDRDELKLELIHTTHPHAELGMIS